MSGNLGLGLGKNFRQIADTDFLVAHQVQQAQPRHIAQRLKKTLDIETPLSRCHAVIIFALTNA